MLDNLQVESNPDPLLDIPAAAEYANTTNRHVRLLVQNKSITVTRVGNKVRIRVSHLNQYLVSRETPAENSAATTLGGQ